MRIRLREDKNSRQVKQNEDYELLALRPSSSNSASGIGAHNPAQLLSGVANLHAYHSME
jgi:hypothetical protein